MKTVILMVLVMVWAAGAKIIYSDLTLGVANTHTYDKATREYGSGSSWAFSTVQMSIDSMTVGDTVQMRGGTYQQNQVVIRSAKFGTSWTNGNFCTLMSYPGEWGIIDGQNNSAPIEGSLTTGALVSQEDIKYWQFLNFEVMNGANASATYASGISLQSPSHVNLKYLYVHNNYASSGDNNPCGIALHAASQCTVSYCYFKNNGDATQVLWNGCHLTIFSDYAMNTIAYSGFDAAANSGRHNMKNVIRYNYFGDSAVVGYKDKAPQWLTGRNVDPGNYNPYTDTASAYGNDISYNIFKTKFNSIWTNQDFAQIHHNIADCEGYLLTGDRPTAYKTMIYNNTVKRFMLFRYSRAYSVQQADHPEDTVYQYIYNNIIDSASTSGSFYEDTLEEGSHFKLDSVVFKRNWSARAPNTNVTRWLQTSKNLAEMQAIHSTLEHFITTDQTSFFTNEALGITNGGYVINGDTTIANGGISGNHPFLAGNTIPGYLGATDPAGTNNWVKICTSLVSLGASWQPPDTATFIDTKGTCNVGVPVHVAGGNVEVTVAVKSDAGFTTCIKSYSKYGVLLHEENVTAGNSVTLTNPYRIIKSSKLGVPQ